MRTRGVCAAVVCLVSAAPLVSAQDATSFVLATYYECDQAKEERADAIFKETFAPLLQKHVDAGHLTTFGWSRHWMGGDWRRLEYVIGTDLGAMIDARNAYIEELMGQHAAAEEEFTSICGGHDDYIWAAEAASQSPEAVGRERGAAGVSTYFECSDKEAEADEIVKAAFAPVLNKHVEAGKISSWVWLRHVMGGEYRRALVFDGASHKSVIAYWRDLTAALEAANPELNRRFGEICWSHSDYVWDLSGN